MVATNTLSAKRPELQGGEMLTRHRVLNPTISGSIQEGLCALGVMTKAPRAGQVKTRLVPPLTPEEAAQLNVCFLRDTTAAIAEACNKIARGVAVYTPAGCESAYADILPNEFDLLPQRGDGFGERLSFAADDLFRCGFSSVCLIDSDSPTVSAELYSKAVESLSMEGDRVVLGPSDDGGYYLIGLKQNHPALFERIDWSTERVFDQTVDRAHELNIEVVLLPTCYDIDDRRSLSRLCTELLGRGSTDAAPNTKRFLTELVKREGHERICSTK
jgi:rSAM/selenodomain-associated transferase 1